MNNFDEEFTREEAINSVIDTDPALLAEFEEMFSDFTYVGDGLQLAE